MSKAKIYKKEKVARKAKGDVVYISSYKKRNVVKAYTKTDDDWYDICRASDSEKVVSFKASRLIGKLILELQKNNNRAVFKDNYWFSKILKVTTSTQNGRIRSQINHIFDFQLHRKLVVKGALLSNVYEISFTEDAHKILNFKDESIDKIYNEELALNAASNKSLKSNINVVTSEHLCTNYMYDKEKVEEAQASYTFSNKEKLIIKKIPTNSETNEEETVNTEKVKPITLLSSEIFRNFDTKTSEEIIENCVFEEVTPSKIAININPSFAISSENKQKIKSCVRKLYGDDVQMVNTSSTEPEKLKLSVVKVSKEEEKPPATPKYANYEWNDMKTKILEHFPLDYYDHLKSAWLDNLNFIRIEDDNIIVRARAFYIDEIFQRFSPSIEIAVLNTKKSLVLQYENNDQKPIEFLYKQILNKSKK